MQKNRSKRYRAAAEQVDRTKDLQSDGSRLGVEKISADEI